eukprot:626238-Amorphochlora_amoeboformis.AAC.1
MYDHQTSWEVRKARGERLASGRPVFAEQEVSFRFFRRVPFFFRKKFALKSIYKPHGGPQYGECKEAVLLPWIGKD